MKWYERTRHKMSPQTASVIGWAGSFGSLIIAVIVMGAGSSSGMTRESAGTVLLIGFLVAAVFVAFWFAFGKCYECGRMPRPFETFCAGCGARLDKSKAQMEAEASKEPGAEPSAVLAEAEKNGRDLTETMVSSEDIFDGVVLHVFKDTVSLPDGRTSTREFLRHLGAVCVVPVTADGRIVVERQYRYAVGQTMVEIPAGKLDYKGEDRLEAAKRELREETGYTADRWTHLGEYLTAPAFSDEKISMYLAEGLHKGDQDLDDDEFLDVVEVPLEELVADVMAGRITDAKTQTGILKAAMILDGRRKIDE